MAQVPLKNIYHHKRAPGKFDEINSHWKCLQDTENDVPISYEESRVIIKFRVRHFRKKKKKLQDLDFPGGLIVKTLSSNGGVWY